MAADSQRARGGNVVQLATGFESTCAILDTGRLRCWGLNNFGQLGLGNTENVGDDELPGDVKPVRLGQGIRAVDVATGGGHTCAIVDTGQVRCWGNNTYGQLGYGNEEPIGDDETPTRAGFVDLGPGRAAVAITNGQYHTCVILDTGDVRCWGRNFNGELGLGHTDDIGDDETPGSVGSVDLGEGRTATRIDSTFQHTCAVLDNNDVRCWGRDGTGLLGQGDTEGIGDDETPGSVPPVDLGPGRTAISVGAGLLHSCALLDNRTVRCWGANSDGNLGYGNTERIGDDETPGAFGPVRLGGSRSVSKLEVGQHSCAVLDNRTVRCWGNGERGALGYASVENIGDDETPASAGPVDVGMGHRTRAISSGGSHTCAILDNREVRCWGSNDSGELGYGNTETIGDDEKPASVGYVRIVPLVP